MEITKKLVYKWGKPIGISVFLLLAFLAGNFTEFSKKDHAITKVLSASIHVIPSPTLSPVPTTVPLTIINNIYVPTPSADSGSLTPTPTPLPTQIATNPTSTPVPTTVITPTPTMEPTETLTPPITPSPTTVTTPTPTEVTQTVEIDLDYAGEHIGSTYTASITSGETAWQAVQDAVGIANLQYTDYGGSLGIFITGFNGIAANSNQYYDFQVNGTSSNVGVSSYIVNNQDVLKFVLTSL